MTIKDTGVSETFIRLWDAFVEAMPEEDSGACLVSALDQLEAAAQAVAEYVAQLEKEAGRSAVGVAAAAAFIKRSEKHLV